MKNKLFGFIRSIPGRFKSWLNKPFKKSDAYKTLEDNIRQQQLEKINKQKEKEEAAKKAEADRKAKQAAREAAAQQREAAKQQREAAKQQREAAREAAREQKASEKAAYNIKQNFENYTQIQYQNKLMDSIWSDLYKSLDIVNNKMNKQTAHGLKAIDELNDNLETADTLNQIDRAIKRANKLINRLRDRNDKWFNTDPRLKELSNMGLTSNDIFFSLYDRLEKEKEQLEKYRLEMKSTQNALKEVNKQTRSDIRRDSSLMNKGYDIDPYDVSSVTDDVFESSLDALNLANSNALSKIKQKYKDKYSGQFHKFNFYKDIINSGVEAGVINAISETSIRDIIEVSNIRDAIAYSPNAFQGLFGKMLSHLSDADLLDFVAFANHSETSLAKTVRQYLSLGFQYEEATELDDVLDKVKHSESPDKQKDDITLAGDKLAFAYYNYNKIRSETLNPDVGFDLNQFVLSAGPEFAEALILNRSSDTFSGMNPFEYDDVEATRRRLTLDDWESLRNTLIQFYDPMWDNTIEMLNHIIARLGGETLED